MKTNIVLYSLLATLSLLGLSACSDSVLEENPTAFLNVDNAFTDPAGFEAGLTGMYSGLRDELYGPITIILLGHMMVGTDIASAGDPGIRFFNSYETDMRPENDLFISALWTWAYTQVLPVANAIIENIDNIEWDSEADRNALLGEAQFGRAYVYNVLVNVYNGVPIVDELASSPRFDFTRASRLEVLEFIRQDLEFAAQWLPNIPVLDGRTSSAAANHLLSEVFISLGRETGDASFYNASVQAASQVIDDPAYELVTNRFGSAVDQPGDYYSDLFKDGNQDRSSGNTEVIWTYQHQFGTPGGQSDSEGNMWLRTWGPRFFDARDPNNFRAFILTEDSIGRGVGWVRPSGYWIYDIWDDPNDIRNNRFNVRREWFYNNPESEFFGQKLVPHEFFGNEYRDTMQHIYPMIRKIEGDLLNGPTTGRTFTDAMVMRLSETYLLRAEAHMLTGDLAAAADDINVVRARAQTYLISASDVNIDFILDERARELIIEEPRRRTLARTGTLVERTRRCNTLEETRNTIQDYNQWFPIPLSVIEANLEAELEQNPGY
ncbi:MAG: RagB/SusD family nutrient uptake outer membrane protein [Bacteroidota bacterium]